MSAGHVRGLDRVALQGLQTGPPDCAALAVGSVPHVDPLLALEFVLRLTPDAPSWPQLPRRSFLENMYVQFAEGLPGLVVDSQAERVFVKDEVPPE
jgi:hypothetical protein